MLFRGNDNNKGVGVAGFGRESGLTVVKEVVVGETEAGTQFRVCRFENLGMIDNICRYRDYQPKALNKENNPNTVMKHVPRRVWSK